MTQEQDYTEQMTLGMEAEQILLSAAWKRAFDTLDKELTEAWKATNLNDEAGRHELFLMVKLAGKVRINLESLVQDGVMAKTKLQQLKERASETFRRVLR